MAAGEPTCGYGRRGLLDLIAGQPLDDTLVVIERACAQAGQAYRLALSMAVERAARISAPRSAQLIRVFFAELEMTLSALWTLTELARALRLDALRAAGLEQRERIYAVARAATGERVYWGIARPGGVRPGIEFAVAREALGWLPEVVETWRKAAATGGALRRAAERVDARQQQASLSHTTTGQAVRQDARRSAPYDGYRAITLDWSAHDDLPVDASDVTACALRLVRSLKLSYDIMRVCADTLVATASGLGPTILKAGQASAQIQTAHGPARIEVTLADDQTLTRVALETRCGAALAEARSALPGRTLAHVPALLAGLGLCPSCADL